MSELRIILIRRSLAAMLILLAAAPAPAILVQPIQIRMTSSGPESSAAITVINDRNRPDTVEISVSRLVLAQQGAPNITKDNGDQFLIFPPVATIDPGKTQIFRIRWVGEPMLPEAQSYMFTTAELPIDQEKATGVQLVYAIQSLVTVGSPGLSSAVAVVAAVRAGKTDATEAKGQVGEKAKEPVPGLMVTFENNGNDVAFLSDYSAKIETTVTGQWSRTLTNDDVSNFVGLGLIEPNTKRDIFIPVVDIPAFGDVKVTLKQEKSKR